MAVVELKSEVAGIVVDADAFFDRLVVEILIFTPGKEALEEGESFFGVFEMAERFGFESEVEIFAGFFGKALDGESTRVEVGKDEFFVGSEFLEGPGESGDRASGFLGAEAGDDSEKLLGVDESGELGPVGFVDVLLHPGAVEGAVGEAVDSEDVAILILQPLFEEIEVVFFKKFKSCLRRKTKPDGECFFFGDPVADRQHVGFENGKGFSPVFGGVNIGAVGEVVVVKLHAGYIAGLAGVASGKENEERKGVGGL